MITSTKKNQTNQNHSLTFDTGGAEAVVPQQLGTVSWLRQSHWQSVQCLGCVPGPWEQVGDTSSSSKPGWALGPACREQPSAGCCCGLLWAAFRECCDRGPAVLCQPSGCVSWHGFPWVIGVQHCNPAASLGYCWSCPVSCQELYVFIPLLVILCWNISVYQAALKIRLTRGWGECRSCPGEGAALWQQWDGTRLSRSPSPGAANPGVRARDLCGWEARAPCAVCSADTNVLQLHTERQWMAQSCRNE